MATLIVENQELAGTLAGLPCGVDVRVGADGRAEVPAHCGLFGPDGENLVPGTGWVLVEGTPDLALPDPESGSVEIRAEDGPQMICVGPAEMANASTGCPDGRTTAYFNKQAIAVVPGTCRLDEVPGYALYPLADFEARFADAKAEQERRLAVAAEEQARRTAPRYEVVQGAAPPAKPPQREVVRPHAPRVRQTQELPLPSPTTVNTSAPGPGPAEGMPAPPLVPQTLEELAAVAQAQASAPTQPAPAPEVAAQLEGSAKPNLGFECEVCKRTDFSSRQQYTAHKNGHKVRAAATDPAPAAAAAPAPPTASAGDTAPAAPSPEQNEAVQAAVKAMNTES